MDWIVDTLHQSHADEKKFRRDAIARLQDEQSKLQNRLDKLYDDCLDGFIEPDFFARKAREWRQTQKRLTDQIAEYALPATFVLCGGAYGTIFATFCCRPRQKCSVCCNSSHARWKVSQHVPMASFYRGAQSPVDCHRTSTATPIEQAR